MLGYYAISSHRVRRDDLPDGQAKGLLRIDVPVILLGRLAVDRRVQGLGALLLIDGPSAWRNNSAFGRLRLMPSTTRRKFYEKFGFVPLLDNPQHLFLPMSIIRKLGGLRTSETSA